MRICENCGKPIPDGDLICLYCGEAVQLVPNYETMESHIQEVEKQHEEEEEFF